MSSRTQNDIIGQQIGNYRLIRWLGQGSFADVYLGEHIHLKRHAAIKILKMSLSSKEREHFLNEACTVAGLDHPHIVRVLEYGIDDTTPFLIMSYATNGSLLQRYPRGTRLALVEVVPYIQQAADALHYAHQQKLIHRDVKPENMLLDSHSQLLLSDFGLVMASQSFSSSTTHEIAGTAPYMAPEQFQGKAQFASDQYALGIVAYELLCGECPFNGTLMEIASQHMLVPPPPLREKVPTLPEEVEQVILRALSKDPTQRFPDVATFAQTLSLLLFQSLPASSLQSPIQSLVLAEAPPASPAGSPPSSIPLPSLPSPTAPPSTLSTTPHASSPAIRPYRRRKLALLLVGVLIMSLMFFMFHLPTAPFQRLIASSSTIANQASQSSNATSFQPLPTSSPTSFQSLPASSATRTSEPRSTSTPTSELGSTSTPTSEPGSTSTPTSEPGSTPTPTSEPGSTPTPTSSSACISITPASLTFISILGQDPPTQILTVKNCGNSSSPLNYTTGSKWILVQPSASTIQSGSSVIVIIQILSLKAGPGAHNGSVDFSIETAHQIVSINYAAS